MDSVYVLVHKNPDTDSICAALTMAALQEQFPHWHMLRFRMRLVKTIILQAGLAI